jgi:Ca2+-binding EF-hand superfamily protein
VVVDEIWSCYDVDGDGIMDKEEVRHFIKEYMPVFSPSFVYSHRTFEDMFLKMDDDGSGTVDSQELA